MFGIGGHKRAGAGDNPVSVAKIWGLLRGRCGTHRRGPDLHQFAQPRRDRPAAVTTTSLSTGRPDTGLTFSPLTNGKLTVSGSAQKDVVGMYVVIGPKPLGRYDSCLTGPAFGSPTTDQPNQ